MNKIQWLIFGIGLQIVGCIMLNIAMSYGGCFNYNDDFLMIGCMVRRYLHAVPGLISIIIGWIFFTCGWFEKDE